MRDRARPLHNPSARKYDFDTTSSIPNAIPHNREFKSRTDLTYVVPRSKVTFFRPVTFLSRNTLRLKLRCRDFNVDVPSRDTPTILIRDVETHANSSEFVGEPQTREAHSQKLLKARASSDTVHMRQAVHDTHAHTYIHTYVNNETDHTYPATPMVVMPLPFAEMMLLLESRRTPAATEGAREPKTAKRQTRPDSLARCVSDRDACVRACATDTANTKTMRSRRYLDVLCRTTRPAARDTRAGARTHARSDTRWSGRN